ncbi:MAG: chemotaxis protein CheW [Sphingorhabdus sp.]
MASLYLIAHINGARVAIDSDRIESLVHVNEVVPVPQSDPSIAGLFALRSRVLTLIDSQYIVTGQTQPMAKGALAVVAEIGGHHFGLLVDAVEDVVSIGDHQIETSIKPPKLWASLVTATASVDGELVMILDPACLVNGPEALAA